MFNSRPGERWFLRDTTQVPVTATTSVDDLTSMGCIFTTHHGGTLAVYFRWDADHDLPSTISDVWRQVPGLTVVTGN